MSSASCSPTGQVQGKAKHLLLVLADQGVKGLSRTLLGLADQLRLRGPVLGTHGAGAASLNGTAARPGLAGAVCRKGG